MKKNPVLLALDSSCELYISYSQFSVFNYGIENPFSDWSPDHVAQGFTLREGAIGIATINSYGKIKINVNLSKEILTDALRVFILPFCIKGGKGIRIASITEEVPIEMADGDYSIIIQTGNIDSENEWCNLSFIKSTELGDTPRILKSDLTITKKICCSPRIRPKPVRYANPGGKIK
jgi:hypothetical protein